MVHVQLILALPRFSSLVCLSGIPLLNWKEDASRFSIQCGSCGSQDERSLARVWTLDICCPAVKASLELKCFCKGSFPRGALRFFSNLPQWRLDAA